MIGRNRDRAAIERRAAIAHRSEHVVPHRIANDARHGLLKAVRNAPAGCCRSSAVAIVDQTALAKPGGMTDKRLDHRGFSFVLACRNAALYSANAGRCCRCARRAGTRWGAARRGNLDHAGATA